MKQFSLFSACCLLGFGFASGDDALSEKKKLLPEKCGKERFIEHIIGGKAANLGEFPWMALLQFESGNFGCGGVLINNRYVLTAAHCVKSGKVVNVRLGEHNLSKEEDCDDGEPGLQDCSDPPLNIPVATDIPHEDYKRNYGINDIALLRLDQKVKFTKFVSPICLPSLELQSKTFAGVDLTAAGWGQTENKTSSDVLLKVDLPVKANSECENLYQKISQTFPDTKLCAGLKGKDACIGDSGGPLMYIDNAAAVWYVIGVVSTGPAPCALGQYPGIYTRVTKYVEWIIGKLEP